MRVQTGATPLRILTHWRTLAIPAMLALGLSGCASAPKSLYGWGDYQQQLYTYLQTEEGADWEQQLAAMRATQQSILERGQALPPGFHAHMGMLLTRMGQEQAALDEFAQEKRQFPESGPFMDFLSRTLVVPPQS